MAAIASRPLDQRAQDPWLDAVRSALEWGRERDVEWRDAILLVPFAQHLPLARRAWAAAGAWMPRIETTQTLARGLQPTEPPAAGLVSFDTALDRLGARRLLQAQSWGAAWSRNDPRAFDHAVGAVVTTAHALLRSAAAVAPEQRADHQARGRALLAASAGPGSTERVLLRIAFEWAAASAAAPTDVLFGLRPSAWIVVQAGGPDPLAMAVLAAAPDSVPCLVVDSDADADDPFAAAAEAAGLAIAICADFEDEAQRTAAQVLADLERGCRPVALVAQDRLLTRRVRALLARQDVPLQDETGWKLSTTRAGACIGGLLRAARGDSSADDWLDWLKGCDAWPGIPAATFALQRLERALRRHRWSHPASVDPSMLDAAAAQLWRSADESIRRLRVLRSQSLATWLQATAATLDSCGAMRFLSADDAGRQVLAALRLDAPWSAGYGGAEPMSFEDYAAWIDAALEDGTYLPQAAADAPVVVTPLERAMLRPFAAVVLAAADEKRLGAMPVPQPLLGDALAAGLGVPSVRMRRDAEALAFAQLLRAPRVTLLRRLDDGGEPLAPSPLLERLDLARSMRRANALPLAAEVRVELEVPAAPIARPLPTAAAMLPDLISASACEALRTCPYQFFALRLLKLKEVDELDDEFEKRDYGTWLHAVLLRFHATRAEPLAAPDEVARLHLVALEVQDAMRFDAAAFLPYAATFARFAPRYVEWLHARDAGGARWLDGERELVAQPPGWAGTGMRGIVDRIDSQPGGAGEPITQLFDYKTGSGQDLRERMKRPEEDTQLAFYAALMAAQPEARGAIAAAYLPLDESGPLKPVEHADVEASALRLVAGVGAELARIRAGAALPALGEGRACAYCAARGLCRRDHWTAVDVSG